MNICLINGNPDEKNTLFEKQFKAQKETLAKYNKVKVFILRDLKIKPCTGCFGCWVKTPGECLFEDDTIAIRKTGIHSDLILFASPIIMGFSSALLKHVQDKLLPLLHPYIEFVNKECHHQKRYESYPKLGLLFHKMDDTTDKDIQITHDIYKRLVINFRSELAIFEDMNTKPEEVLHALNLA